MPEKSNPIDFEKLMRLKEKNIGGPDDAPSPDTSGAVLSEESRLSEDEAKEILKASASSEGVSEDERFKQRPGYATAYQEGGASAMALGMRAARPEAEKTKPIEEQRNEIRVAIQNWKYIISETNSEAKEKLIEGLRKTDKPDLVVEEVRMAMEKDPENIRLKELYELINPYV